MLKVGVIGLGAMGKHHARIYSEFPDVELVGVADIDEEIASSVAKRCNTTAFSDYRELLKLGVDAVSVAVPTSLHREVGVMAAKCGANILMEKPISNTVEGAEDTIKNCRKMGVKLMIGHVERFNPVSRVMRKATEDCEVMTISVNRLGPFPPRIRDVGVILDLAIHDIDLARYITGSEFKKIHSLFSKNAVDDHENCALLSFEMVNGVLVQLAANWLTPFKVREINIAAREKFIKGWLQEQKVWEYRQWKEDNSYIVKELAVSGGEPLRLELQAFLEAVRNDRDVPVSGEEGLKALTVALECLRDHQG